MHQDVFRAAAAAFSLGSAIVFSYLNMMSGSNMHIWQVFLSLLNFVLISMCRNPNAVERVAISQLVIVDLALLFSSAFSGLNIVIFLLQIAFLSYELAID